MQRSRAKTGAIERGCYYHFSVNHFKAGHSQWQLQISQNAYRQALRADWASPAAVKREIGSASALRDGRVVFNVAGNKYRIVVWINYPYRVVYVRFIGTQAQYDEIDAQSI